MKQSNAYENLRFAAHVNLIQKYTSESCFFFSKPIHEIVDNHTKALSTINIKDIIFYSEDWEYMRRQYRFESAPGKKEIEERIQMVADFYSQVRPVTTELPLMFLTNTQKIFKARLRRLRKMKASDGSSDESEPTSSHQHEYPSSQFLKSLQGSNIDSLSSLTEGFDSIFKSLRGDSESEEDIHDIYQYAAEEVLQSNDFEGQLKRILFRGQEKQKEQVYEDQMKIRIKDISSQGTQHLICDFDQVDPQKTIRDYQRMLELANSGRSKDHNHMSNNENQRPYRGNSHYTNMQGYGRQPSFPEPHYPYKPSSISIAFDQRNRGPRKNERLFSNGTTSTAQLNPPSQPYLQRLLAEQEQRNKRRKIEELVANANGQHYRGLIQDGSDETYGGNQTKSSKRQRIRDKAAELLSRVKNQNYIQGTDSDKGSL